MKLLSIKNKKTSLPLGLVFFMLFAIIGCASYQGKMDPMQKMLVNGQAAVAANKIKEKAFADGKDQVVYLFEYATAMQIAGNFEESNKAYLLAEHLTDIKDYHSISKITASLLSSARMKQYKGEDYEKVLINGMLAINFLMLKNTEAAMVETRKLNDKLHRYRFEAKKKYEQNAFAFYLAALIREQDRDWDGAYIDYNRAYKLNPSADYLKKDLIRAALRARRSNEATKWKKKFGLGDQRLKRNEGEIVLIYQQGWAPRKRPHPNWRRIPKLFETTSFTNSAQLEVAGKKERAQSLYSVTDVSLRVLNDAYASIIAERAAGVAAKAVVADQVRQKNKLLGDLAWIGMNVMDQADLRQWLTLPSSYQVAKVSLPAGEYKVNVQGLTHSGSVSGESMGEQTVVVKPGQKTFINWRSLR